jgi:hypothetical protein
MQEDFMLFGLFICSFFVPVHAAIPPNANMARPPTKASIQTTAQTAAQTKVSQAPKLARILSAPTAIVGGEAGSGFSLLNIKKELSASGRVERLVIDVGDINGKPNFGPPSYYHAQLMKDPAKLVLDFSQMPLSLLSEKQLVERLKGSKFVRRVQMTLDPEDQTLSMILDLKPATKIRLLQIKGVNKTSQLVVDFL